MTRVTFKRNVRTSSKIKSDIVTKSELVIKTCSVNAAYILHNFYFVHFTFVNKYEEAMAVWFSFRNKTGKLSLIIQMHIFFIFNQNCVVDHLLRYNKFESLFFFFFKGRGYSPVIFNFECMYWKKRRAVEKHLFLY